jgi:hypothetical protein
MSITNPSQSDPEPISVVIKLSEHIRQRVDDRHWQLFETRLKNSVPEKTIDNYTKSNDYRIIDRFKKIDQPQTPIEPNQRWEIFCSQLTNKSNETKRLVSLFHNVWTTNWNITQKYEISKIDNKTNFVSNENNLVKNLTLNEHDKKIISSILHSK